MCKIETATRLMEELAANPLYGYDQIYRWGEYGDYDCSSAVIHAWETAGVPVKSNGASYTGNMRGVFLRCGFEDVTGSVNLATGTGLQRGDVLLNHARHAAMYIGGGREVEASINERGTAKGGKPGDQTGKEFLVRSYRNYPWDCVLRYTEENVPNLGTAEPVSSFWPPRLLVYGMVGADVVALQGLLSAHGYELDADGEFGPATLQEAKTFQKVHCLDPDGIVGPETWAALVEGV